MCHNSIFPHLPVISCLVRGAVVAECESFQKTRPAMRTRCPSPPAAFAVVSPSLPYSSTAFPIRHEDFQRHLRDSTIN